MPPDHWYIAKVLATEFSAGGHARCQVIDENGVTRWVQSPEVAALAGPGSVYLDRDYSNNRIKENAR